MQTKTRRELVNQALKNLGVLAAGQTASDEDYAAVDDFVDPVIASLGAGPSPIVIADDEAIDPEMFLPLALMLAAAASTEFGGTNIDAAAARAELRRVTRSGTTYETLRATYY